MFYIHTYTYNHNKIILPKFDDTKIILWNYLKVLNLLKEKYNQDFIIYFKRLVLNKSRENFIKYIILKEFGNTFINIELLKTFNHSHIEILKKDFVKLENKSKNILLWSNEEQSDLTKEIFEIKENILNDDIIMIKNSYNNFVEFIIEQIDKTKIPLYEYENKIYLGNIFLSNKTYEFMNLNENKTNENNMSNSLFNLDFYFNVKNTDIEIKKIFPFDLGYKIKIYPNVPNLSDGEKIFNSYDWAYKLKKYVENILIFVITQYMGWTSSLIIILMLSILDYLILGVIKNNYIQSQIIPKAQVDNEVFFNPHKYKFLSKLKKNWKTIQKEAIDVMNNSPKLEISRTIDDWYDANQYINNIKNKYGWIRSWTYDPEQDVSAQVQEGNYEWLNYGLLYFGEEFGENIKYCPETFKLLMEIKDHINICGFSWMLGGSLLLPHKDITGLSSGSLAYHLGLKIPKPEKSCCMVIKNSSNEYMYMEEQEGKIFIFDATNEHYAYNQTNEDRLILYIDFKII